MLKYLPIYSALLLLASCSHRESDDGSWVHDEVQTRIDKQVRWFQGRPEDLEAQSAIQAMLEHDLTVDAAVQVALLNNPSLQATFEEIGIAEADLIQAGLLKNPVFDGYVRFPNPSSEVINTQFSVVFGFLDIFMVPLRKKAARTHFQRAKSLVADSVLKLAAQVEQAFYSYQAQLAQIDLQRLVVDALEVSFEVADRQFQAGNVNSLFVEQKKIEWDQEIAALEEMILQNEIKYEELSCLLGLESDNAHWNVTSALADIPPHDPSIEELEDLALGQRFDVLAARQEVLVIAQVGAQKKWWAYTDALVGVSYEREADGTRELGPSWELAIPLFNYGQADRHRLRSQLNQSKQNLKALELDVRCAVNVAEQKMATARSIAESYASQILPETKEVLETGQRMYNVMAYGVYDLLDNKMQEVEALMKYEMALRDYWIARAEMERAIGGKVPSYQAESE